MRHLQGPYFRGVPRKLRPHRVPKPRDLPTRSRRECATDRESGAPRLPFNCFDSGLPFDLDNRFNTTMYEGQEEPILLGGLVAKNVDELESTRLECRTELGQALARRGGWFVLFVSRGRFLLICGARAGDGVIDPVWLDECPKLNVIISARVGWTSLNSREFIQIYLGAEQSFWSPIAFLGYTIDVNAAMRMIRYRMSDGNEFFNR